MKDGGCNARFLKRHSQCETSSGSDDPAEDAAVDKADEVDSMFCVDMDEIDVEFVLVNLTGRGGSAVRARPLQLVASSR